MAQEMLFGFCYMPQIIRVEDFSPYWVLDRWTKERTLTDLKIMRAIGTTCIRVHITPPVPGATSYDRLGDRRTVPITGEKYLAMTDLIVQTAHDMGIAVHFDIGSSLSEVSETSLDGWLPRYRGLVESYQFANENYGLFQTDMTEDNPLTFERYARLLRHARQLDPTAKFTADMFTPQLEYARDHFPDLYNSLDILNTHPYYCTDHRAWTEEWIRALVAVHSQGAPLPDSIPWMPERITLQNFVGIANFGKELWITETAATGDGVWSSLVQDETEASSWRNGMRGLAQCEQLKRIYWCWFTDKMHSVEAGVTQAGAVNYDGSPTPLTQVFREVAQAHAPSDSIIKRLTIEVDTVSVAPTTAGVTLGVRLYNNSQDTMAGRACLELPEGLSGDTQPFEFELEPGGTLSRQITLQVSTLDETHNHVLLRVEAGGQVHYGWGMVVCPRPLTLAADEPSLPGVQYIPGMAAVQDFLTQYGDQCAIVVGPGTGHWDVELGYRIKIVIGSLHGIAVPIKTWFMLPEVWDQPLIIVGRPVLNFIAQLVELGLPAGQKADALGPGEGFVQVVEKPLGEPIGQWNAPLIGKLVGFHKCPAALYIAGGDDEGSKRAIFDLIKRLWHPKGTSGPKAWWT